VECQLRNETRPGLPLECGTAVSISAATPTLGIVQKCQAVSTILRSFIFRSACLASYTDRHAVSISD